MKTTPDLWDYDGAMLRSVGFLMLLLAVAAAPIKAQTGHNVSGNVSGIDGKPMADVWVRAARDGMPPIETRTDAAGRYRLEGLPAGTFLITAGRNGENWGALRSLNEPATAVSFTVLTEPQAVSEVLSYPVRIPILTSDNGANAIRLGPARIDIPETSNESVNFVMFTPAVKVSGRLSNPAEEVLPTLSMSISALDYRIAIDAVMQENGVFEFAKVPPGKYTATLTPNLGIPPVSIVVEDKPLNIVLKGAEGGVPVGGTLASYDRPELQGKRPDWIYLVERGSKIVSRVTMTKADLFSATGVKAMKSVPRIQLVDAAGEVYDAPVAPVGDDGRFDFLSILPGDYTVRTIPEAGIPNSRLVVTSGVPITDARVGRGVRVGGEVIPTNAGTRPPETITLIESGVSNAIGVSALINDDGRFEFPRLGSGTYRVLLDGKTKPSPAEITVDEDGRYLRLETPFSSWIRGRVVFAGTSLPPEKLSDIHVTATNGFQAALQSDGSFRLKSNDGEYELGLRDLPDGYVVQSITYGAVDLLKESMKVDASTALPDVYITLQYKPVSSLTANEP